MTKEKLNNLRNKIQIRKSNKGITLVALIITIVVMLILVAVTLSIALGDNGVLNTSKEAKEQTEISKEKEQLMEAVFATAGSNGEVNLENIILPEGFKEILGYGNKIVYQGPSGQQYEVENGTGKITEVEGINLDASVDLKKGDIVTYGDYKYTYSGNGWSVAVLDKTKEKYGKIAEEIYGKPITNLESTFAGCTKLKIAPEIPKGIVSLKYTFQGCSSLEESPRISERSNKLIFYI